MMAPKRAGKTLTSQPNTTGVQLAVAAGRGAILVAAGGSIICRCHVGRAPHARRQQTCRRTLNSGQIGPHHAVSGSGHKTLKPCEASTGRLVRRNFLCSSGWWQRKRAEYETDARVDRSIDPRLGLAYWCKSRRSLCGKGLCQYLSGAKDPTRDGAQKKGRPQARRSVGTL